ncbi:MAG: hypothetical protein IKB01_13200, partial [Lachnospiraceae bacterium]|nr:hypothetical protein [Lachnospiraceae bacterium]
ANEEIQSYSEQCMMIYDYIAYTPYEEVAVEYLPIPVANYASMALTNDPNFWLNLSIARYYGKDAVWVVNYY